MFKALVKAYRGTREASDWKAALEMKQNLKQEYQLGDVSNDRIFDVGSERILKLEYLTA